MRKMRNFRKRFNLFAGKPTLKSLYLILILDTTPEDVNIYEFF